MSPLNITQPLDSTRYMVYNGYYKVMSNIPKMGHLPTPALDAFGSSIWKSPWSFPACRHLRQSLSPSSDVTSTTGSTVGCWSGGDQNEWQRHGEMDRTWDNY